MAQNNVKILIKKKQQWKKHQLAVTYCRVFEHTVTYSTSGSMLNVGGHLLDEIPGVLLTSE